MYKLTFLKKEINEIIKTHKIIVLPAILLFFGLLSPLAAKFMNWFIEPMLKKQGINITLKEPTLIESYGQFVKNFSQLILIAVVLLFMGVVVDEKIRGSVILVLTKSVSRSQYIIAKFCASALLFTFSYILSLIAFSYYSYLLFNKFLLENTILSLFMLWLMGLYVISLTIFASTIGKSHVSSAIIGFAGYAVTMAASSIPYVKEYSPGILGNLCLEILNGAKAADAALIPVTSALVLIMIFIGGSIAIFKKQEL